MKVVRIAIGLGMAIMGLVIYPYYITYAIEPIEAITRAMFPALNIWQDTFLSALPLIVILVIGYIVIMTMLGKIENKDV